MESYKVELRSYKDTAHLNPQPILQVLTLQLQFQRYSQGQGNYAKAKSRSHYDVAHLHPETNVPNRCQLLKSYHYKYICLRRF